MTHASTIAATGVARKLVALRAAAFGALCLLFAACPNSSPSSTPAVMLTFSQSRVCLEPGETGKVMVAQNRFSSTLSRPAPLRTAEPLPASDLDLTIDQLEAFGRSALTITVAADARPGRHDVAFSRIDGPDVILPVIVAPTDSTPRMGPATTIAAGESHTLAIATDGAVWAWGRNEFGQLGDGTLIDRIVPIRVEGLPLPAIAIAAGDEHSLVLLQDNTIWGFGSTDSFRLRTIGNNIDAQPVPIQVSASNAFAAEIAAGSGHGLLRDDQGAVLAWGANQSGQTSNLQVNENTAVSGLPLAASQVTAAYDVSYAVLTDNMLWAWGNGSFGQLGPSANGVQALARPVLTVANVTQVAAGLRHTLVLSGSTVQAFGDNAFSQLGDGSLSAQTGQPAIVPRLISPRQIAAGRFHSLALQANQQVQQWGLSSSGQAGPPVAPANDPRDFQLLPERVTNLPSASAIDAGGRHSLALTTASDSIYGWGSSTFGQLGDGTIARSRDAAAPVYGTGSGGAERHVLAVLSRGRGTIRAEVAGLPLATSVDASRGVAFAVAQSQMVTLTALPDEGRVFLNWGAQASGTSATILVSMDRSRACIARFGTLPRAEFETTLLPSTVRAVAELDADLDGCIEEWQWDVDNDGSIDGTGREFAYDRPESASELRLVVTDNDGLTASSVQQVEGLGGGSGGSGGSGGGPNAAFFFLPEEPFALFPVTFRGGQSSSPLGPISSWQWDFTNDGSLDASGEEVQFSYPSAGVYTVRLVVTDQNGQTDEATQSVTVLEG
ncbi:MAG: PKD domain-containing protein [Planctomycetota bacterium]